MKHLINIVTAAVILCSAIFLAGCANVLNASLTDGCGIAGNTTETTSSGTSVTNLYSYQSDSYIYLSWSGTSSVKYYKIYRYKSYYNQGSSYYSSADYIGSSYGSYYYDTSSFENNYYYTYWVVAVTSCGSSTYPSSSTPSTYVLYYYNYNYTTYGSLSQVPSSAESITVDEVSGSSNVYQTRQIISGYYNYFYFYASSGTTYYFRWADAYCYPSKLTGWNKTPAADIYVAGCMAGAESSLTTSDETDGTTSPTSFGSTSVTVLSSGYYVIRVRASTTGWYGIRVSTY